MQNEMKENYFVLKNVFYNVEWIYIILGQFNKINNVYYIPNLNYTKYRCYSECIINIYLHKKNECFVILLNASLENGWKNWFQNLDSYYTIGTL